jgi:hypothetical protein
VEAAKKTQHVGGYHIHWYTKEPFEGCSICAALAALETEEK